MLLPGFTVSDEIVGKRLSFDVLRLEKELESEKSLQVTDESSNSIIEIINQYYEQKREIADSSSSGNHFSLCVYDEDVDVLVWLFADVLQFEKEGVEDIIRAYMPNTDNEVATATYEELLEDAGISVEIGDTSWEDLSDYSIDVDSAIKESIPSGPKNTDFTIDEFRGFVFDYVKPAVDAGGWRGGNAWIINLGLHELRSGNYQEASYAFEGARLGLTKGSLFERQSPLSKHLNNCLISLRELCAHHDSPEEWQRQQELFISIDDRPFIFVPQFIAEPRLHDQHFRFSNSIWIANALVLVAAVSNAMDLPTVSRDEVDPFGTNTTARNSHFVLKAARRLSELDRYSRKSSKGKDRRDQGISYLRSINFKQLAPEIIITRIFSDSGFTVHDYGGQAVSRGDGRKLQIPYDSLLSRDGELYVVKLVNSDGLEKGDVEEYLDKLQEVGWNVTLILLSTEEYEPELIDYIEGVHEVSLYYLDMSHEYIQSIYTSEIFPPNRLETPTETLEYLKTLSERVQKEEDSQRKGKLLEDLMSCIFEQLIVDTNVVQMNVRSAAEEMDLLLRNDEVTYPWKTLGDLILVECKNWSNPAGTSVVKILKENMASIGPMCKTGILIAWEGISDGDPQKNAAQKIREYRQNDFRILVLDKNNILELIEHGDTKGVFEKSYEELLTR